MFDVVVIGAGIMGAAVSRELSKYELKILLLDKENDVSCGTTKANSAIVHAGYDAKEGSLMAKYNVLGNAMYEKLCEEVDAPFRRVGSYVLAFSEKEKEHLEMLYQRGLNNGVPEMEIIDAAEIQKREPHVSKEAVAALYAGTAGITGPWELATKLIENAMENGVELKLNSEVTEVKKENDIFKIKLKNGEVIETKKLINAAGVYADFINNMLSSKKFKITPRIGEYYLLDKVQGYLTDSVIFQCPTEMGKGILVSKTVHGNIIVGPTASDVEDKDDVGNTQEGLDTVRKFATKSIKDVNFRENIRNFAGLRAEADTGDFILGEAEDVKGFFNMAGTKSPGLTSSPAMAVDLAKMAIGSFIPGSGKILDLISSGVKIENNLSSSLNFGDKAGTVTFSDLYKKKVGEKMSDSSTLSDHLEKYCEYDQRITKREQFLAGSIFDTGGRHLTGNSKDKFVKYDLTYDLQANLKIHELEKNGLKTFVYHNTKGDISKKISSIKEYERTMKKIASTNNIDNPKDEKNERLLTQNTFDLFINKGNIGVNNVTSSNIYEGLTKLDNKFTKNESRIFQREKYLKWDPYGLSTNDSNFGIKQENS